MNKIEEKLKGSIIPNIWKEKQENPPETMNNQYKSLYVDKIKEFRSEKENSTTARLKINQTFDGNHLHKASKELLTLHRNFQNLIGVQSTFSTQSTFLQISEQKMETLACIVFEPK